MAPTLAAKAISPDSENSMTRGAIADELFIQMCDKGPLVDSSRWYKDSGRYSSPDQINKYYLEAARYAARASVWSKQKENIFHLKLEDFSEELQNQLFAAKEGLDLIVTVAVFKLLRARHTQSFFEYIQPKKLRWDFNGI